MTLSRSQQQAFTAIRTHFRETGCAPSLGDLSRRLRVSRQRACALVHQLERAGLITRRRGEALSIRLVGHMGNFSDDDLLCQMTAITEELLHRGVDIARASVSVALKKEFPLTIMELPSGDKDADILAQLEGGDVGVGGQGQGSGQLERVPGSGTSARRADPCPGPQARAA